MTSPTQARRAGQQMMINLDEVMTGLHERYAAVIGQLIQENSELTSGLSQLKALNAELIAKVTALQADTGVKVVSTPSG